MRYNRPQATASWGTMAKDWEKGIDYDRLHKERVKRAKLQAGEKSYELDGLRAVVEGQR